MASLADGPFSSIVVDLQAAVGEVDLKLRQTCQGIADRFGEVGLRGDLLQLGAQPHREIIEHRPGFGLTDGDPPIGRLTARFIFDRIELGDARDSLGSCGGAAVPGEIEELAADVREAGDLVDAVGLKHLPKPGIAVCCTDPR